MNATLYERRIRVGDPHLINSVDFRVSHNPDGRGGRIDGRAGRSRQYNNRGVLPGGNGGRACRYSAGQPLKTDIDGAFITSNPIRGDGNESGPPLGNIGVFRIGAEVEVRVGVVNGQAVGKVLAFQPANVLEMQDVVAVCGATKSSRESGP